MSRTLAVFCCLLASAALDAAPPASIDLESGRSLRVWTEPGAERFAIERDDGTWTAPRALDPRLHLRRAVFDPLAGEPALAPGLASPAGERLVIVQLRAQWLAGFGDAIEDLGGEVAQHLPATGRLVRIDPARRAALAALPFVRWVGDYHPAYRTERAVLDAYDGSTFALPTRRYVIRLVRPDRDRAALAARIAAVGGVVDRANAGALLLEATLTPGQLHAVLGFEEVLFVDVWSPLEPDVDNARGIGGADVLESIEGYDGDGVRGEVMDVGFNLNHVDFASRPLIEHGNTSVAAHGASTSGIIFGDGTGDAQWRGILPAGQGIVSDTILSGPARYNHTAELVAPPYEAVFQSCSVGSSLTTQYTNVSAELDQIIRDFDFTIVQSQSNANSQNSRPQAWAKNIIAVGGIDHENTLDRGDDNTSSASHGPAADGRVKPDLCHFYESIGTVTCCGPMSYTNSFGGTSGATPIVAGYLGLFYDLWADGVFGNEVTLGETVFFNRSHQSTAKAMTINSAQPYDWTAGGPNGGIDRFRQGWGVPSIEAMWEARDQMLVVDEDVTLANLASEEYAVTVLPGEPQLRVTLTWADLPGTTSATLHRINDLDLRVSGPNGDVYRGNVGLIDGVWSVPGGDPDTANTVENVFIADPEPGAWTIAVIATELNEDGDPDTPDLDTRFALVARGVEVVPPPLVVKLAAPVPALLPPGLPLDVQAIVADGTETLTGTPMLHYRTDDDAAFTATPLVPVDGEPLRYTAEIPALGCPIAPAFYLSAESTEGTVVTHPATAPEALHRFGVGLVDVVVAEPFDELGGWTVVNDGATAGFWERGLPPGGLCTPHGDFDGGGSAWLTGLAHHEDVDGGTTTLLSPVYDVSGVSQPVVRYARSFCESGNGENALVVEVSGDGGATWKLVERVLSVQTAWTSFDRPLTPLVGTTDQVQFRFSAVDDGPDAVVEAAIDLLEIIGGVCTDTPADLNGDGAVDFDDLLLLLLSWGPCELECPADLDGSGDVGAGDLELLMAAIG